MLRIIIENEEVQKKYIRLKDSLGSPTDSILIDMLIEKCNKVEEKIYAGTYAKQEIEDDHSVVKVFLDDEPQKKTRKRTTE